MSYVKSQLRYQYKYPPTMHIRSALSKKYDNNRIKNYVCGARIDIDTNGSRNIYVKSICSMPGMKARLASLQCQIIE